MKKKKNEQDDTVGYPLYPANEDIYNQEKEETDIDPEDVTKTKDEIEEDRPGKLNEKDFYEDQTGEDLDVPGSEEDEEEVNPGNEDEENNYYSLGGDDHENLEEDKGD